MSEKYSVTYTVQLHQDYTNGVSRLVAKNSFTQPEGLSLQSKLEEFALTVSPGIHQDFINIVADSFPLAIISLPPRPRLRLTIHAYNRFHQGLLICQRSASYSEAKPSEPPIKSRTSILDLTRRFCR